MNPAKTDHKYHQGAINYNYLDQSSIFLRVCEECDLAHGITALVDCLMQQPLVIKVCIAKVLSAGRLSNAAATGN